MMKVTLFLALALAESWGGAYGGLNGYCGGCGNGCYNSGCGCQQASCTSYMLTTHYVPVKTLSVITTHKFRLYCGSFCGGSNIVGHSGYQSGCFGGSCGFGGGYNYGGSCDGGFYGCWAKYKVVMEHAAHEFGAKFDHQFANLYEDVKAGKYEKRAEQEMFPEIMMQL